MTKKAILLIPSIHSSLFPLARCSIFIICKISNEKKNTQTLKLLHARTGEREKKSDSTCSPLLNCVCLLCRWNGELKWFSVGFRAPVCACTACVWVCVGSHFNLHLTVISYDIFKPNRIIVWGRREHRQNKRTQWRKKELRTIEATKTTSMPKRKKLNNDKQK